MINFALSEEQRAVRDLAREFARNEIAPLAAQYDRSGEFPWPVVHKAFDVGLAYPNIPEVYGGPGLAVLDECLIAEELCWGCAGIAGAITVSNLVAGALHLAGAGEQKQRYLPELLQQRKLASYALTEPGAGSDAAAISTTARRGDGGYLLSGTKSFITNAGEASYFLVFAKTDPAAGHRGLSAFLLPRDAPGLAVGPPDHKMGQRAADTRQLFLEDVRASSEQRLGAEGDGFKLAMEVFNRSRPTVGAVGVGIARRAFEMAAGYANQRQAFGRPILDHQGVGFLLADMFIQIEAARLLCWQAAWRLDQGLAAGVHAAAAKCFAADVAMRVATDAVQVFGGYGYLEDYGVEKLMRDAKVVQIYEGTSQIQRLVIARSLKK
jgi:acyl-CoA dehydrogenase